MFGSVVPHHCKWAEILHGVGLEMVVQWGSIYDKGVVEAMVWWRSMVGIACS